MTDFKLPINDVKKDFKKRSIYQYNQLIISIIPKVFFVLIVGLIGYWIVNNFSHISTPINNWLNAKQVVNSSTSVISLSESASSNSQSIESISIFTSLNSQCVLDNNGSLPQLAFADKITQSVAWQGVNCGDITSPIYSIQTKNRLENTFSNYEYKEFQAGNYYYYIFTDKENKNINLTRYEIPLLKPILDGNYFFNPLEAAQTRSSNNFIIYSEQTCQDEAANNCNIWLYNKTTGIMELIYQTQVAKLNIAKIDEKTTSIALVDQSNSSLYKLIFVNYESGAIINQIDFLPVDSQYQQYLN